jgi:hypothetical protein
LNGDGALGDGLSFSVIDASSALSAWSTTSHMLVRAKPWAVEQGPKSENWGQQIGTPPRIALPSAHTVWELV